jgi:hypothetical protein
LTVYFRPVKYDNGEANATASEVSEAKPVLQYVCKGTYACVRPRRYTYGIYWNTVANVDASDSRCRCIGKIIARDLMLVASRLNRMAVTRPRVTCRRYSIPLLRRRPPGLHIPYKRQGKALYNHAAYVLVQAEMSRYRLAPYGSLSVDPAHGETPPPID